MIRKSLVIGMALLLAGCSVRLPPVPSSPPVVPSNPASPTASATPPLAPTPLPTPGAATLPPILSGVHVGITRICEGPREGEVELVDWCRHAIDEAVDALGPDAGRVAAAWFRAGVACPPNARCVGPSPDVGHVVLRLDGGPVLVVALAFTVEGFAIEPARQAGWDIWPIDPRQVLVQVPPVDLGPGAPPELADREPYGFCGSEDDVFDRNVRRCFWDAVTLHQSPAEFITAVPGPDGGIVRVVHRYAGSGPVLVYRDRTVDPAIGAWTKESCALETVGDDELLFVPAECVRLPLD